MLSLVAFALQAAYSSSIHQSTASSPYIEVPPSTVQYWYEPGHFMSTHHLRYIGPPHNPVPPAPLVDAYGPLVKQIAPDGYTPAQIRAAYNLAPNLGSEAIAIVDAYDLPDSLADFNTFSAQYGLPQETSGNPTLSTNKVFQVVYAQGSQPASSVTPGWNTEEDLDIEWAHSMAPNAKIYLVETTDNSLVHLYGGDVVAAGLPNVKEVSDSWGAGEYPTEAGDDGNFSHPGVVFFFSTGDAGGEVQYPAHSPNVVAVGGTRLYMSGLTFQKEIVWGDFPEEGTYGTGGGPSAYEPRPAFQSSVASIVGAKRGGPDIAASADPDYGAAIYGTAAGGWLVYGGTSWACPTVAGIANAGQYFLQNSQQENSLLYSLLGTNRVRDITVGGVDVANIFNAMVGWDFCTGVGTPLNIGRPLLVHAGNLTSASSLTGKNVTGGVPQLEFIDQSYYTVTGVPFASLGSTGDVRASFVVSGAYATPGNAAEATISVTARANYSNIVNEIFVYNQKTKNYDLLATPILTSSEQTFTVNLTAAQAPNYIDINGNVVVLSRALLPQSEFQGANSSFLYSVDQIAVSFGFNENNGGSVGGGSN